MATRIKLKRSTVAATVPTTSNLEDGEVALNIADRKLYARNGGNIIEVANQKPNTGEVVTTMLSTDITDGQGSTWYVASVGSDTTTLANGGAAGKHPDTPFLTITKALSVASSGDTILVAPGEYQEAFPMTVPDGVTLRGTNLRSTQVKPTGGTTSNTAFILSGDTHVSDFTIKDFFYDSGNDDGYGFELVASKDSVKSPYIERVTVATKGSVTSGADPYGYAQGDAGRGAKLDGAKVDSGSQHAAVLFNECTFITPNQVGLLLTNGIRVEWLNSFCYFASVGIQGVQGATGKYGTGQTRLKLGGVSGTFSASEVTYQLEDSFQSGTYARAAAVVTLTRTGHGLTTNDYIYADHISGGATDNYYQVTVVDANTFTYTDSASGTIASGNVTYKKAVARGVLASNDGTYVYITGKGTGQFVTTTKAAKTTSRFGDTQIDTNQKKFGTAAILFDGTEDALTVPTSEDFGFGTSNWCLEAFIRPNSVTGTQHIFDLRDTNATDTAPKLYLDGTTLHFGVGNSSVRSGGTLATGTWYHVAVARNGGTTKLFLDGVELGTGADTNDYGSTKPVRIGANYAATPADEFDGHIDEVRISKGAARFTGAFTPTTSEYSSDLNTVLLLHANGDDATTTFTDNSGGTSDVRSSGGDSATSVITADYSQFGCELRSVASANVYGLKGVQADGAGVKLILTAHNFGYIGAQSDYTNDPSLAVQANEVEELNGGKVLYSSTDQDGDFRVGDAFTVDQETGNVQFQATSTAQSAANITLSDGTGTTNIYPAYIETGNLRIAGNSLTSTTGQVIVDPAGQEDFVVNAETIVKEAVYFDVNKSISFGSVIQGALNIAGFNDSTLFGSSEASCFSTRSFVVMKNGLGTVNLTNAGTGYVGGLQPIEVTTNPFQLATATCVLETDGALKSFALTARGSNYTAPPTVTLTGGGTGGGAASATLGQAGIVNNVSIQAGGANYSGPTGVVDPPQQNIYVGDGTYNDANNVQQNTVDVTNNTIRIENHSFETGMACTLDSQTQNAAATAPGGLAHNGSYFAIRVDKDFVKLATSLVNANAGTEIDITSTGTLDQFLIGTTATVTLGQTAGVVDSVTVTDAGTGYQNAPAVTVSDSGTGAGCVLAVDLGFAVDTLTVGQGGVYTSAPTVGFTLGAGDTTGSGAAATATIGFPVASVTLTSQGLGYRNLPVLDPGTGDATVDAQFTPVLNEKEGRLSSVTLSVAGEGYTSAPTLTFTGGGGTGGSLEASIQSLTGTITAAGSGYTAGSYPNVTFTGGSPDVTATATFTIPGLQGSITAAGSGYLDGTYAVSLRNTPTATYTVTVAQRDKLIISSVANGPFQVGETVTGSSSGVTATVTYVDTSNAFIFVNNASGTFSDAQVDTITGGTSNATATLDTLSGGVNRYFIDTGSGATEAANFTLLDNNTYRFDTSDSTNAGHPLQIIAVPDLTTRQYGTPGDAGSYFEVVLASVSGTTATATYSCTTHGTGMSENAVITFSSGALGDAGDQMTASLVVVGGAVTTVTITSQGTNYQIGDVLLADDVDLGGQGGSGFSYTLQTNTTGVTTVTDISLDGAGYAIGDVLSVDDATVGGGGGSGFQYTVSDVGFCTGLTVAAEGTAYEAADTLILGPVGGANVAQGSGLTATLATINSTKQLEMSQLGVLTLGPTGATQLTLNPDGQISAGSWSISGSGSAAFQGVSGTSANFSGVITAQSTSTFTGLATFNGGITTGGVTTLVQTTASLADGAAATPTLNFDNSQTTGLFRQDADVIGISIAGVETFRLGADGYDGAKLQIDSTLGNVSPFFKVDPSANSVTIGPATNFLSIDNTNTIKVDGSNVDIPLNFETKGGGDFIFKGGTDKDFSITDGSSEKFKIETLTGDVTVSGNLDAGLLRILDNAIINNSTTGTRSFGQIIGTSVTGSGSGYTDGTYTATATTTNGVGSGCTVTVTVSGGDFSAVTVVDKGQNYAVGDTLTIAAVGGGSGRTVNITDVDGLGVELKPSAGFDVLCNTTGSLIVPSGTTNERPNALDRRPGAIRYNTTQLQFEGYNGTDFVSLGGVRDVDQDTYILTESAPGADEDTFEFFAQGQNNLAISKDTMTLKGNMATIVYPNTSFTHTIPNTLNIDGTSSALNPLNVKSSGVALLSVRSQQDVEISGGLRLRNVPSQGVVATLDAATLTQVATSYTASQTFTGLATTAQIEGTGLTVDVTTDGNGTVTTVAVNAGGTTYQVGEVITIAGTLLGGTSPAQDVTIKVDTISGGSAPYARNDVLLQNFITRLDNKFFIDLDANGSEALWKINKNWGAGGTASYQTVFDSTADFMELDDCRVEGGQMTTFTSNASITAFDKTAYKGAKTLITVESDDGKVHMFEVTAICAAGGTVAHATVTNSITSDNDLMDATVSVAANSVNISLNKSSAATTSTSFTGRYTTTKVKV